MDLCQTQTEYSHKKFQGYKKFVNNSTSPLNPTEQVYENQEHTALFTMENQGIFNKTTTKQKRSTSDIFRPYALEEKTALQKRKHQEIQDEEWQLQPQFNEFNDPKRFATSLASPSPSVTPTMPVFFPPASGHFPMLPVSQQYQLNPQTCATLLQKQHAALCMGEMLKRQSNFNILYNIMGN